MSERADENDVLHLTPEQCRRVDEIAAGRYRMPTILLMENAARSAAVLAGRMLRDRPGEVLVLAGPGSNGGDGFALARFLANGGREVAVALVAGEPGPFEGQPGDARVNYNICVAMGLEIAPADPALLARPVAMVVDAMFGTGLRRPLEGVAAAMARGIDKLRELRAECLVLALDVPSGLDSDTGEVMGDVAVRATVTITFGAPKTGFMNPDARQYTGDIVIGDIGVPRAAIEEASRG